MRSARRAATRVPALLFVTLALGACELPTVGNGIRHGVVTTYAFDDGQGNVIQKVSAGFVDNSRLRPDFFQRDTCIDIQLTGQTWNYLPTDRELERIVGAVYTSSLRAGSILSLDAEGTTTQLLPALGATGYEYTHTQPPYIPATPGSPFTLTIPGEGNQFPAAVLEARFAEPISFDTTTAAGNGLTVTWTPAPTPGSRAVVTMQYRSSPELIAPRFELVCSAPDTGSLTLTAAQMLGWLGSPPESRSFGGQRMRFTRDELARKTVLFSQSVHRDALPQASANATAVGEGPERH